MTKWRVDDAEPWRHNRVLVTGGGGFLGRAVVAALRARGAAEILTPRRHEYDLRDGLAIQRLLADSSRPGNGGRQPVDLIVHLAAHVGGIGANRAHPAEFFYDNLMMGVQLLHEAWRAGIPKFVAIGTVCAYPKFTPCRSAKRSSGMAIPRRPTRRTVSRRRCSSCSRRPTAISTATTRFSCCRSISTGRGTTSIRLRLT